MSTTSAGKVRTTKVRQQHSLTKVSKPGKPYNGPNLVAQRPASPRKTARKSSARKTSGASSSAGNQSR